MNILTIHGMHCDACKKLITIELEDAGLTEHISSLEVTNDNTGTLVLTNSATDEVVERITNVIHGMGNYTIE